MTSRHRPGRDDRGTSDVLGIALLAPALIGLALVVLWVGRGVDSRASAQSAAESAAQAAARQRSLPAAVDAGRTAARAMLTDGRTCADPTVQVVVEPAFEPGATVVATVTCGASAGGLELIGVSGTRRATATAYAVIDPFRGVDP